MPGDVLAPRLPLSRDLPRVMTVAGVEEMNGFTLEQQQAIERRDGGLFLDAGAGSGKTSVLVERFARGVIEEGLDPRAILTITFTEKAAAEMRERIRARLGELGIPEAARDTEGAFISTIHGFCARVLRTHALAAGIDPGFAVLDELEAGRLADAAFTAALTELADEAPGALELISSYGRWDLRSAIQALYDELRSRGERHPRLPPIAPPPDLEPPRNRLQLAGERLSRELRAVADASTRVVQALARLERVDEVASTSEPWPGDLAALRLPGGNGAALSTDACSDYSAALEALRSASAHHRARRIHPLLDRLLATFGQRFERLKRERGRVDFEDLELLCRELLREHEEVRDSYRQRFARVMVDELQDTNQVQLDVIDMVAGDCLFTVGDAQQSIYAFRHADVELFQQRGAQIAEQGARATLRTNFRSRPEILEVVNRVFERELGESFMALVAGRSHPPDEAPRVELIVADREADWTPEGLAAPWRVAEARALARRVGELVAGGVAPADVVVLSRAATDLRAYERALEERGVPTYLIGGRGYWSHPQVVDLLAYLRVLANPRDEEALYTVLASPLVGASTDGLVLVAAAARESGRDPWWVLRDPEDRLEPLAAPERELMVRFADWVAEEREAAARLGVEALIERALERTGYDLQVLGMPGGQRRLANVRKLMRLGRRHTAAHGPGLRGFLDLVALRSSSWITDPDPGEAPVESEGLDAVRLMTIHRAKGLEFPVVCVADLGRAPRWSAPLVRVGRDGRLGIRLARPGTGRREAALAYDELADEARVRAAEEERRLFYVAMTRAQERLILSGAARLEAWGASNGGSPMAWLGPALVADVSAGEGVSEGVRYSVARPESVGAGEEDAGPASGGPGVALPEEAAPRAASLSATGPGVAARLAASPALPRPKAPGVSVLSYTSLAAYQRCGYRFYVERVLGVPARDEAGRPDEVAPDADEAPRGARAAVLDAAGAVLDAAERGTLVHALLERLDFRRPVLPSPEAVRAAAPREPSPAEIDDVLGLLSRFAGSELRTRLGRAARAQREQRFAFLHGGLLITGMLDVIASELEERTLIVDYKTDRLDARDPADVVAREYATQRLIYALAALRAGAASVDVVHVFLQVPEAPVTVTFTRAEIAQLEARLTELTKGLADGAFTVTDTPQRTICHGCPAEGGLCSWPLEMTRRPAPDRLF